MISVDEALAHIFALVGPLETETVPLRQAAGRVLAARVAATRAQPPFPASAMDGYGVAADTATPGTRFRVIGEAAAGSGFAGCVGPGETIRIFTGAPVPEGVGRIVIQEDVSREGDTITLKDGLDEALYIRPAGADFRAGETIDPPRRLAPSDIALLAAMNVAEVTVTRKPDVVLIATGDELVMPGETPGSDQIIASNIFGLAAMIENAGGIARVLPIARDNAPALTTAFDLAAGADLVVTIGGASVGDHDLVGQVAAARGMERAFYRIAMRPGKPLMAGRLDGMPMIGLPGNQVSAMVCGSVFILPALRAMQGFPPAPTPRLTAPLAAPLGPNGPREHYMRARLDGGVLTVFDRQDSALLSVLSAANVLVVRPVRDGPRKAGEVMEYIPI